MRIVNRKEFLSLPPNTLFAKYKPCVFEEVMIKMKSLPNDWFQQQIVDAIKANDFNEFGNKLEYARLNGDSVDLDFDCCCRDALYGADDTLFAVFEKKDVEQLIDRLKKCLE